MEVCGNLDVELSGVVVFGVYGIKRIDQIADGVFSSSSSVSEARIFRKVLLLRSFPVSRQVLNSFWKLRWLVMLFSKATRELSSRFSHRDFMRATRASFCLF